MAAAGGGLKVGWISQGRARQGVSFDVQNILTRQWKPQARISHTALEARVNYPPARAEAPQERAGGERARRVEEVMESQEALLQFAAS